MSLVGYIDGFKSSTVVLHIVGTIWTIRRLLSTFLGCKKARGAQQLSDTLTGKNRTYDVINLSSACVENYLSLSGPERAFRFAHSPRCSP